ncbi:MAG: fumarylacetoacetate hydrolase [Candidatus Roseilinea sp.]|nr:MAG: fumarylacetoacetate hydrolase [Candidatus Roseilinea sp.]
MLDGRPLSANFTLTELLRQPAGAMHDWLTQQHDSAASIQAQGILPPIEPMQEVWASGVTYLRSRDARKAESSVADVYQKVYDAERPELFMKAIGWRAVTSRQPVRIRKDSTWNVPEPELTLVINAHGEIVGYTAGNDMSSRDIEGENPLYLPQAKIYTGACALGPEIVLTNAEAMRTLPVTLEIRRGGAVVFSGETSIARMKRGLAELVSYLYRELDFPDGAFLMTGTGIVPPESFSLRPGDHVKISVGEVTLENEVI